MTTPGAQIGLRLKQLRHASGLTQARLASLAGAPVDRAWISAVERGESQDPGSVRLTRVARVLGVSVEYLTAGHEQSFFRRNLP